MLNNSSSYSSDKAGKLSEINIDNLISIAECATGGAVMARVVRESGASKYYVGGVNTYRLEEKVILLGVDRDQAAADDCVSPRIAGAMAKGVCKLFKTLTSIATTGYLEPQEGKTGDMSFIYAAICISGNFPGYSADILSQYIRLLDSAEIFDGRITYYNSDDIFNVFVVKISNDTKKSRKQFQTDLANYIYEKYVKFICAIHSGKTAEEKKINDFLM